MALLFLSGWLNYIEFIDLQGTDACYKIQRLTALKTV
jgi:hypothetical protein